VRWGRGGASTAQVVTDGLQHQTRAQTEICIDALKATTPRFFTLEKTLSFIFFCIEHIVVIRYTFYPLQVKNKPHGGAMGIFLVLSAGLQTGQSL
jgi:hypothetical protein